MQFFSFEVSSKFTIKIRGRQGKKAKYVKEEECVFGNVKLYRRKLLFHLGIQVFLASLKSFESQNESYIEHPIGIMQSVFLKLWLLPIRMIELGLIGWRT